MLGFFLKIVLCFVLPPAAVFWQSRLGLQFWINLVLTIIGWIPGVIHALWVILRNRPKPAEPAKASPSPAEG
jgi:uncharacterized membrane protein YqaE (UPF0057 family)